MSKVAIQGNASGTGTFTIAAPNSNTDRTLTLPDEAGTVLTSASNAAFPAGSVIQVVQSTFSLAFSTSNTSPTSTGLAVTITPKTATSKILVLVTGNVRATASGGNGYVRTYLYRDGSNVWYGFAQVGNFNSTDIRGGASVSFLDAPATTSPVTYDFRIDSIYASSVYLNDGAGTSTITAIEVAA